MAKIDNQLDIPIADAAGRRRLKSISDVRVPRYSLYGDAAATREWFVNVEPLDQRASALHWKIEPHTHPKFTQLVFVGDGGGDMTLDGDSYPFASPCVLVIPPFRIHGFRYIADTSGTVVTIENNYLGDLLARAPDLRGVLETAGPFSLSIGTSVGIADHIVCLRSELSGDRKGGVVGAEIQLLQIALAMLRDRPATLNPAPTARSALIDRFLDLVEARYREQPDIDAFADSLKVTSAQLRSACKTTLGLSPLAILHDRIVAEAKRSLIYTTMSIADIGYALGFEDAAYFTRFFTRLLGVTPTKFRAP